MQLGTSNALPVTTVVQVGDPNLGLGVLDLDGYNQTLAGLFTGAAGPANNVAADEVTDSSGTASTLTVNIAAACTFAGFLAGNLSLVDSGPATLTLSGANRNVGDTTVVSGALEFIGAAAIGQLTTAQLSIDVGATAAVDVAVGGDLYYLGNVTGSGTLAAPAGTLTLVGNLSSSVTTVGNIVAPPDPSYFVISAATAALRTYTITGGLTMPSGAVTANTWQQAVQDSVSSVGLNIVQNSNPIYQDFQGASQIIYPGTTLDPSAAFLIGTADDIANAVGSIFDLPGLESQDPSINGGTPMIAMEDEIGQPWCDFDYNDFVTVLQVQQATTTTVSSSLNPSTVGQAVTFTATVTPASGTFDGGGSVQFTVGGTSLGSVSLNGASTVTIQDTNLNNAGNYTVEAVYSGDTNFSASSATMRQTVNPAATTTTVSSSLNPSTVGQSVAFTATVGATSATFDGGGSVQFLVNGWSLGTVNLNGASTVTIQDPNLATAGSYSVTAVYSGDGKFKTSTSPVFSQTVNMPTVNWNPGANNNWNGNAPNWNTQPNGQGTQVTWQNGDQGVLPASATVNVTSQVQVGSATLGANVNITSTPAGAVDVAPDGTTNLNVRAGSAATISAPIAGNGNLTVGGGGTLNLGGVNTYTGTTTLDGGSTLNVVGAILSSSSVVVTSGTTLTVNGTISGTVLVTGGTLTPGSGGGDDDCRQSEHELDFALRRADQRRYGRGGLRPGPGHGLCRAGRRNLSLSGTGTDPSGAAIVLIRNIGGQPVSGIFAGLPQGTEVTLNDVGYDISYVYNAETGTPGTGNDVALLPVAATTTTCSVPDRSAPSPLTDGSLVLPIDSAGLVYISGAATGQTVLSVDTTLSPTDGDGAALTDVTVSATMGGQSGGPIDYGDTVLTSGQGPSSTADYRFAVPISGFATGRYVYTMKVVETYADHTTQQLTFTGDKDVLNWSHSSFGPGWNLIGLDSLAPATTGGPAGVSLVQSDGTTGFFLSNGVGGYTSENGPFAFDTLTGSWGSGFTLKGTDGTVETFNEAGQLAVVTDADGNQTTYNYASVGGPLESIVAGQSND